MGEKIPLKEVLAAVDSGYKGLWDELDDEQRKALKSEFFILNRYISNVKGQSRELQEHFILTTNEYFNKHWNDLQKHPKLMWMLLSMASYETKKLFYHEWIGFKKKTTSNGIRNFLIAVYPDRKEDEIDLLAKIMSKAEIKELAQMYGYEDKEIAKILK